jgi:predicted GNAT family acetyltransferase
VEKGDEIISAATIRLFGKKVAELPLVATRFSHRRQGMCRLLLTTLEQVGTSCMGTPFVIDSGI